MQIVILAGGLASRLGNLASHCPKSMIRIAGKPFLEHQIDLLRKGNVTDIILCTGHLGGQIESYFGSGVKFGVRIRYSRETGQLLGTGGCLKNAEWLLDNTFFVMYGDSYLVLDYGGIETEFRKDPECGLMVVYRNENRYDRSNVAMRDGRIVDYGYENYLEKVFIDEGISVIRKEFLGWFERNQPFPLEALFNKVIEKRRLRAWETSQRFFEVGSLSGMEEFSRFMKGKVPS